MKKQKSPDEINWVKSLHWTRTKKTVKSLMDEREADKQRS
jgi:hypothetical protein